MPDQNDARLALIDELTNAITEFNAEKATLVARAQAEGGDDQVHAVIDALSDLEDARFELQQRSLDVNNPAFDALAAGAKAETGKINETIDQLESVAAVIKTVATVVDLVGRIVIRFGL